MINSLKKSVIHLEGSANSENLFDVIASKARPDGSIDQDAVQQRLLQTQGSIRATGTATFLRHGGLRYLLTARHVVHDKWEAKREIERAKKQADEVQLQWAYDELTRTLEGAKYYIFHKIFRVPSLDEIVKSGGHRTIPFIMNLGAGSKTNGRHSFSSPELDLAIISLDAFDRSFGDDLEQSGYIPIDSSALNDVPLSEGDEIATIGFPEVTSHLDFSGPELNWGSNKVSLPVCSFGRVSMLSEHLDFFWADMSIYPGNSGGPVFSGENIVGLVSANATIPIEDSHSSTSTSKQYRTRIPFAKIIKTSFVKALIAEQEEKDQRILRS